MSTSTNIKGWERRARLASWWMEAPAGARQLHFLTFRGVVSGSNASGTVLMGEYGDATWTAVMS
jgi:hypothetical protein